MYARLAKSDQTTGASEVYSFRRLAGSEGLRLSLWPSREQACAEPTAEWYEVERDLPGAAHEAPPTTAVLICLDGPLSGPVRAAVRRANTERIGPRVRTHAGIVRSMELWQPERQSMVVVVLATSVESIEDMHRMVRSLELLPGEEPALLPEPDRVDLYRMHADPVALTR